MLDLFISLTDSPDSEFRLWEVSQAETIISTVFALSENYDWKWSGVKEVHFSFDRLIILWKHWWLLPESG